MKIFGFFKGHLLAVLACALLLVIQANLELSLPNYMSNIVDVGLQQGGIESPVPKTIRAHELESIESLLPPEDASEVQGAFSAPDDSGICTYTGTSAEASEGGRIARLMEGPESTLATDADLDAQVESSSMTSQRAIEFVRQEYESQGLDMAQIQNDYFAYVALIMFALCAGTLVTTMLVGLIASRTAAAIARDARRKLFNRVMSFSPAEVQRFSQASLITRTTNDIQQVQMVCVMLMRMVMLAPIMGIVAFAQVTATRSGMEWVIGVALIAIFIVLGILLGTTMPRFKRMQRLIDRLNLVSRDMLDGIMPIRAFGREDFELDRFREASSNLMGTQLFVNRAMSLMMPAVMLIMNLITLLIVWVGCQGIDMGNLQVGTMMAFITYTMQIVMSFMVLGMISVMLPRAQVAAARIGEVMECQPSIADPPSPVEPSSNPSVPLLEFEDVTFGYPDANRHVIRNISFSLEAGKTIGIIGSTGSGKSTIAKLIPRLYDVTDGVVRIDGIDVRQMRVEDVRKRIGYVPQEGFLFSGTIASNIKFADESMPDEQMDRAARIAQALEFIEKEPEGFDEPVSQKGTNVSGGQRQRLSIARAIAASPQILVFDDAFSALDYITDTKLREALRESAKDTASVIVAQRVATIMHADEILVLESGDVVGRGTHEELLESCDTYREIALSQLSSSELGIGGDMS